MNISVNSSVKRSVRLSISILTPCTDSVLDRVAVVGSDEEFGDWDVQRAKVAKYMGSDGWLVDAVMYPDRIFDFQLLILRPAYSSRTAKFIVRHREDFGIRRFYVRRKPMKILLEYNTLPAKIMELPSLPGDLTYQEEADDQAWQRIGMYSSAYEDVETMIIDDSTANNVNYTVLKDPLVDTSGRSEVKKRIKEVEERYKIFTPTKTNKSKADRKQLDNGGILDRPMSETTGLRIERNYKPQTLIFEEPHVKDMFVRNRDTGEVIEDVIYAVCIKRGPEGADSLNKPAIDTQENMKDVKGLIKELEERDRQSKDEMEKRVKPKTSHTSGFSSVPSNACTNCVYIKSEESQTCSSDKSSVDLTSAGANSPIVGSQSSNSVLDSFVYCHIVDNHTLSPAPNKQPAEEMQPQKAFVKAAEIAETPLKQLDEKYDPSQNDSSELSKLIETHAEGNYTEQESINEAMLHTTNQAISLINPLQTKTDETNDIDRYIQIQKLCLVRLATYAAQSRLFLDQLNKVNQQVEAETNNEVHESKEIFETDCLLSNVNTSPDTTKHQDIINLESEQKNDIRCEANRQSDAGNGQTDSKRLDCSPNLVSKMKDAWTQMDLDIPQEDCQTELCSALSSMEQHSESNLLQSTEGKSLNTTDKSTDIKNEFDCKTDVVDSNITSDDLSTNTSRTSTSSQTDEIVLTETEVYRSMAVGICQTDANKNTVVFSENGKPSVLSHQEKNIEPIEHNPFTVYGIPVGLGFGVAAGVAIASLFKPK